MSSTFTLPELLDVVKEAYKCVEVRTIAARIDGTTYNVVTLIQFSTSSPKECEEEMRSRLKGNDLREDGPLQFAWKCLPAAKWPELAAQLAAGKLRLRGLVASLGMGIELRKFANHIDDGFGGFGGYINNPTPYPMFQARVPTFDRSTELGRRLEHFGYSDDVLKQLRPSGFAWFRELASAYLGAINNDPGEPSPIVVLAPVPAMVDRVELAPDGHRIRARVLLHPKLKGSASLKGYIGEGGSKGLKFGELVRCKEDQAYAEADSEPISPNADVKVRLVHSILEIVHARSISVRQAVPDGTPVPDLKGAAASASGNPKIEMPADSSAVRARRVLINRKPGAQQTKEPIPTASEFAHDENYRNISWAGKRWSLTPSQAAMVQTLHEQFKANMLDVPNHTLLDKAGLPDTSDPRDTFKNTDNAELWGDGGLIVPGKRKGTRRLSLGKTGSKTNDQHI